MIALFVASFILGAADTAKVTLEPLPMQTAAIAELPKAELTVTADGHTTRYSGVPLAAILGKRSRPIEGMPGIRDLADAVILVHGEDGYQAAISAAAVLMDPKGERYLLATSKDGKPHKPQLIIPGDPKRARWVKEIASIRLVRLDQLGRPAP